MTAGARLSLKPHLNPPLPSYPAPTQPLASPARTSLYAQALHMGENKREAPALQEANTGSLGALPDRLPLSG
jgi:hypothetical protein